jgi:hypothetical protein
MAEYVVKKAFRSVDETGKRKVYMPGEHITLDAKTPEGLIAKIIEVAKYRFVVEVPKKKKGK